MDLKAIGVIHSPFFEQAGTPIQGALAPDTSAEVEVLPEYADGLEDLDGFDYIWLIYGFDRSKGYELRVRPYMDDALRGLFATRAPRRPNPIGMTLVRLVGRRANVLDIAEVDILDGTPLYDIKPYIPNVDRRPEPVRVGWLEGKMKPRQTAPADDRFSEKGSD
jgi:tRNA-Thr(GGU) m(6)t(6)A37 methyltransferase TsaA